MSGCQVQEETLPQMLDSGREGHDFLFWSLCSNTGVAIHILVHVGTHTISLLKLKPRAWEEEKEFWGSCTKRRQDGLWKC